MNLFYTNKLRVSFLRIISFTIFFTVVLSIVLLQSRHLSGLSNNQNISVTAWSNTAVTFPNNQPATILNLTETQIDMAVPVDVVNGNVFVTTNTGTSNNVPFEVGSSFVPDESGEAQTWQSTFSGSLSTDTTWDSIILLTGDVTVPAGVTLTINGGSTIFGSSVGDDQATGRWTDKTELLVFGTLRVNGTETNPVYFTSDSANKSPGDWGGIQIREGSTTSELSNCMIRYATEGVGIHSQDIPGGGDSWANIQNCTVQNNEKGITIRAKVNWPDGVHINVGGNIKNNVIANNVEEGIYLWIWCGYQSAITNPIITNNVIAQNGMGIYLKSESWWLGHVDERSVIRNNIISNNVTNGIMIETFGSSDSSGSDTDSQPIIENNLLFENEANIYLNLIPRGSDGLQYFQPTVRYNTISDAPRGIVITETEPYDTFNPIIDQNVFEGFDGVSNYAIANESSRIAYVNDSYWGSSPTEWDAGMPSNAIIGSVFSNSFMDSDSPPLITMLSPGTAVTEDPIAIYGANLGSLMQLFLPVIQYQIFTGMEPIFIGNAIPVRPIQSPREVFYSTTIQIPHELPSSGNFYLSAQPYEIAKVLVDDEVAIKLDGTVLYTHDFSTNGVPQSSLLVIPRITVEQMAGQAITVEYLDVYGDVVTASEMWLIWVP